MMLTGKSKAILAAVLAATALVIVPAARAEFAPADWQYYRTIQAPAPGPDGFVGVPLDAAIFGHAQPGLRDLRLIGADGKEIPYVLVIQRGAPQEAAYAPAMINAAVVPGQQQEFVLDLGERGKKNNEITLATAAANFKRPVKVFGSDDAAEWKLIREGFSIFDFSGDVHVSDLTLRYPENIFRYLKVEIGLDGGEPLAITGATMRQFSLANQQFEEYEATVTSGETPRLKATELTLDFHHRNLPLIELDLGPDEPEFYRRVEVFKDREFQTKLTEGVIYRYTIGDFKNQETTLSFEEKPLAGAVLRIYNRDNPPLTVKKAVGRAYRRVLVFRPPAGEVRLYYGAQKSAAPAYDLAALYPKLAEKIPPLGAIKPEETANPDYKAPVVQAPVKPKDYRWVMWLVIIVVGGFLAFLVFRSMGEIGGKGGGKDGGKE
jgi:hypothetical protein